MRSINTIHVKEDMSLYYIGAFIIFLSVFFQSFYIDVAFAVKPFMMASIPMALIVSKYFIIPRFLKYELLLVIFFIYYCITGLFSRYKYFSLRLIILIGIVFFFYAVLRFLLYKLSIKNVEKIITHAGLIFNITSLAYFIYGALQLNFIFWGNNITSMGLLIDRGMPRMVGTSIDPNIFVLFNSLFFFYFLERRHKIGIALTITTMLLTFSRGGYVAILIPLIISFFGAKKEGRLKMLIGVAVTMFTIPYLLKQLFKIDIWGIINERFISLESDQGSGRYEIWENALTIFQDYPLFGIGIYNFQQYNLHYFNDFHYPHNTYLEILVELGIVGLFLYLTLLVVFGLKLYQLQKAKRETRFLLLTFISMVISMFTLSLAASEFMFLFFALSFRYIIENEKRWNRRV